MSILDEELVVSNDSDFDDLFPKPDDPNPDMDDELDPVIDKTEYEVEEAPKKKRGRKPAVKAAESPKKPGRKKKIESDEEETPAPKKRGRPAKKHVDEGEEDNSPAPKRGRKKKEEPELVVEEVEVIEEDVIDPVPVVKKERAKRVSVDDFSPEMLDRIYEEYSLKPAATLGEELDVQEKYIHRAIGRMKELFEMSISTGDLTDEDYEELIAPKLEAYQEPKDSFDILVKKTVKKIKDKKK